MFYVKTQNKRDDAQTKKGPAGYVDAGRANDINTAEMILNHTLRAAGAKADQAKADASSYFGMLNDNVRLVELVYGDGDNATVIRIGNK